MRIENRILDRYMKLQKSTFTVTEKDLEEANKIHFSLKRWNRRYVYFIFGLFALASGVYFSTVSWTYYSSITFTIAGVYFLIKGIRYPSLFARWCYRKSGYPNKTFHLLVDEKSIETSCKGSSTRIDIKEYEKAFLTDEVTLLYINSWKFHFYFKKYLSSEKDYEEFQALVREKIANSNS